MADESVTLDEDESILKPLREKFPGAELQLIRADKRVGPVVFRSPNSAEYSMYVRSLADENTRHVAGHNLFVSLCVYPPSGAAILDKYPGFLHSKSVQKALAYLAGSTSEAEGKS